MKTINCFEVMGHTDTTEGRGPMKVVARFSTRVEAIRYTKSNSYASRCVMGYLSASDVNNIRETTINIFDSFDEIEPMETAALKAAALAKLTAAEKRALGV